MVADIAIAIYSSCDTWDRAPTFIDLAFQPTIAASTRTASRLASGRTFGELRRRCGEVLRSVPVDDAGQCRLVKYLL